MVTGYTSQHTISSKRGRLAQRLVASLGKLRFPRRETQRARVKSLMATNGLSRERWTGVLPIPDQGTDNTYKPSRGALRMADSMGAQMVGLCLVGA